jgi:soluble lytic murein transglycosylase-like protein
MEGFGNFQQLQAQSGLDQANVRKKQLAALRAALMAKAQARGLEANSQTFRQLLLEELQQSQEQRGTQTAQAPSLTPFPTVKRPNVDSVDRGDTLAPFPYAGGKPLPKLNTSATEGLVTTGSTVMDQRKKLLAPAVQELSQRYGLDPLLVHAVIMQESGYKPSAVSQAGALGLMQLMPATAKGLGVTDPLNPLQNLEGGVKYLAQQVQRFGGNIPMALAAYNAGPNAVAQYGGIPPYSETKNYVRTILVNYLKSKAGAL